MKFNVMAIVFMVIAIALGTLLGSWLTGLIGFGGGIIGALLVGFVIYVVYTFLQGQKIRLWTGVIFAVLVWIANMIAGMVQGATGIGGGLLTYVVQAVILAFLWGYFGGGTSPLGTPRKKRRRKK